MNEFILTVERAIKSQSIAINYCVMERQGERETKRANLHLNDTFGSAKRHLLLIASFFFDELIKLKKKNKREKRKRQRAEREIAKTIKA